MTLPESWLAPTSLTLSRPTTEMNGMATRITLQTDGNAITLINNSSYLPCLKQGEIKKISGLFPARCPQRSGRGVISTDPHAHANPHAHITAATRHGLAMHPKDQFAKYLIFLFACVPDPWSSCSEQARLQQLLWACVPSASPLPWLGSLPWRFAIATLKNWSCQVEKKI